MAQETTIRVADPNIERVLAEFLAEQDKRLSARTFRNYSEAVGLLEACLDSYAYYSLDDKQTELFDRLSSAPGDSRRRFCQIFGPELILPNMGEFLGYFLERKVFAGKELLRACGTMAKKLARWLHEKGYAEAEDADDVVERATTAGRELPLATELTGQLADFADTQWFSGEPEETREGHFMFTDIEPGRVWLEGFEDPMTAGPIELPHHLTSRLTEGWMVSGIIGRKGKTWKLLEVWNVTP